MKTQFKSNRLELFPETIEEDDFCQKLQKRMIDSNRLMGWHGDITIDNKETCGYVITEYNSLPTIDN